MQERERERERERGGGGSSCLCESPFTCEGRTITSIYNKVLETSVSLL